MKVTTAISTHDEEDWGIRIDEGYLDVDEGFLESTETV